MDTKEKSKLLLIDAYSIICRGFYALPLLSTDDGLHTNALLGFLNILFRTIDEENPMYIAVAFDENAPTFRHKLYSEYKGQRAPMPQELKEQVPYVKEVLDSMNIKAFSKVGFEADDMVGSLANKFANDDLEVVILSGDKDMLQLATDNIKIRLVKTVKSNSDIYPYYANDVEKEYGMTPMEFIDLKAIMGDPSDNIKGIKGIGKITAGELISKYKSITNIYEHLDEIKKPSIVKALKEAKDSIELLIKLVTIVKDVEIDAQLQDLKIENMFNKTAFEIMQKYSLKSLYKKFDKNYKIDNANRNKNKIKTRTENEINLLLKGFEPIDDDVNEVFKKTDVNADNHKKYVYDLKARYKELDDTSKDSLFMPKDKMDDLTLMSYLINPLKKDYDDIKYIEQEECYNKLYDKLKELDEVKVYEDIELPLVKVLYNMEKVGVGVSVEKLKEFSKTLKEEIDKQIREIYDLAGEEFNINSPKQLSEILFTKLGLDYERRKGEKQSTGIEVLEKIVDKHKIIAPIIEYRTYNKLLTTYADALPKYIEDGRIHTTFLQTETATGRLASAEPNLQNIPIRTKLGRELRKAFVPKDGYIFIDADYSQIELRIMAILSGDEGLLAAYKGVDDVHTITASEVFGVPIKEVTSELRRKAKAINFGLIYGMSSFGLSEGLHIDTKDAKIYIEKYFDKYKKVKTYLDKVVEDAKENAYVRTYYGRIRPIPEFLKGNAMQKAFAKRVAMNSPIQGTAADIMKIAMTGVFEALVKNNLKSRLVMQVHDEILIETKIGEEEQVKKILKEQMTDKFSFPIDLAINISTGQNWDEAH